VGLKIFLRIEKIWYLFDSIYDSIICDNFRIKHLWVHPCLKSKLGAIKHRNLKLM